MSDYVLFHHGVKGMKWGVRKDVAKEASSAFREASNIAGTVGRQSGGRVSKKTKRQLSTMSDAELRAKINRMQMEQQYANLSPSRVSRGAEHAKSFLEVAGNVAAIASTAIGIMVAVQKLKGKGGD